MREAQPWSVLQGADAGGPGLIATVARLRRIELRISRSDRAGARPDARALGALVLLDGSSRASRLVDRVLGEALSPLDVVHRHRGTFDLADGATALATGPPGTPPAVLVRRAYGLPFHLEVDSELAARWAGCPPGVPTSASLRAGVAVFDAFARLALAPRTVSRRSPTSRRTP